MKPLAQEHTTGADSRSHIRSERIDAVVVCSDDMLLIELGPILGERYRTHTVDTPADIAEAVAAPCWIGIVDVESLPDARSAVARMELQFHRCPLILIASQPQEWSGAIARGGACAALSREEMLGPRFLEALTVAEARLRAEPADTAAAGTPAVAAGIGRIGSAARSGGSRAAWIGAVALLGLLGAGGWWLMHRAHPLAANAARGDDSATAAPVAVPGAAQIQPQRQAAAGPGSAAAGAPKPQSVLELLSAARVAFRDQKLLLPRSDGEPRGDSALELYTQVLSQDPDNDEAQDGVKRLLAVGKERIQADLAGGKLDDAGRLLGFFKDAGVSADALSDISASISAARPRWLAQRAQQAIAAGDVAAADSLIGQLTASGAEPAAIASLRRALDARKLDLQLTAMAAQVKSAIAAADLLQPENDNARTRLNAMRALARNHPATLAAQHELQAALLDRAAEATQSTQFDVAQRFITAAADLGSSAQLADARRGLQAAMSAAAHRAAVAAAAARAPAAVPAALTHPSAAAPSAPARPAFIAAHPVRALRVAYPDGQKAQGFVIVEFTLQPNGSATKASVVQSSPPGIFDRVALDAVGRGHYDTRHLTNGQPVRARILLRFKPD